MKVGEQDQVTAQEAVFTLLWLFDLNHHLGALPDFGGTVENGCTRLEVFIIPEATAITRVFFDQHFMIMPHQLTRTAGG